MARSPQKPSFQRAARFASGALALLAATGVAPSAGAQPAPVADARDKAEASRKFREGELAFARNDYMAAALAFEGSYKLAAHPNTLVNAIESWEKVGNALFAARQCLRLQRDFPSGKDAAFAAEKLERLAPRVAQIEIRSNAGAKSLVIDAVPAENGINVVEPGEHVVSAEIDGKPVEKRVRVGLGGKIAVDLASPAGTAPPPSSGPVIVEEPFPTPLHTAFFTGAATLTVASGALLIWSGLDATSAYDDFEASPSQQGLDDGRSKETRTNVLIGTTAGLGVITAAIGVFTDWDGSFAAKSTKAALRLGPTFASIELTLP